MKLSKLIKELQDALEEHGDHDCYMRQYDKWDAVDIRTGFVRFGRAASLFDAEEIDVNMEQLVFYISP